jgi:hypothetical protein
VNAVDRLLSGAGEKWEGSRTVACEETTGYQRRPSKDSDRDEGGKPNGRHAGMVHHFRQYHGGVSIPPSSWPVSGLRRALLAAALLCACLTVLSAVAIRPHIHALIFVPLAGFWLAMGGANLLDLTHSGPADKPLQALLTCACLACCAAAIVLTV